MPEFYFQPPNQGPQINYVQGNPGAETFHAVQKEMREQEKDQREAELQPTRLRYLGAEADAAAANAKKAQAEVPYAGPNAAANARTAAANASRTETDAQAEPELVKQKLAQGKQEIESKSNQQIIERNNVSNQIFDALDAGKYDLANQLAANAHITLSPEIINNAGLRNYFRSVNQLVQQQFSDPRDAKKGAMYGYGLKTEHITQALDAQKNGQASAPFDPLLGVNPASAPEQTPPMKAVNVPPGGTLVNESTGQPIFHNKSNVFPDETLHLLAERAFAGDKSAFQNLGRGAQGSENIGALNQEIQKIGRERGLNDGQIARTLAFAQQNMAGGTAAQQVLGRQEAKMGAAGFEAKGAIQLAQGVIDKVPRTTFLPFNKLIQGYDTNTLNPDQAELFTRTQGVINTYAAVMARGANVTTDASRHRAEELLNTAYNPETYRRVLRTMESEINMALNSPEQMRQFYRSKYGSGAFSTEEQGGQGGGGGALGGETNAAGGQPYTAASGPGGGASPGDQPPGGAPQQSANPPPGTPQGAKQAPDGNWYLPDPNRPGKYLQVVPSAAPGAQIQGQPAGASIPE